MKMNKKLLAVILAGMMSVSVFVGCSSTNNSESTNTETTSVTSEVAEGTLEAFYSIPENLQAFEAGVETIRESVKDVYKDMDYRFKDNTIVFTYEFLEPTELTEEDKADLKANLEAVIDGIKETVESDTGVLASDVTIIYEYCNPGWELLCSFEF